MEVLRQKIIIADGQFLVVDSLHRFLSEEFGSFDQRRIISKEELTGILTESNIALLIFDYNYFDFEDIGELRDFLHQTKHMRVLVMINSISRQELIEMNGAGIKNIILKTAEREDLLAAIKSALTGKKFFCQEALDIFTDMQNDKGIIRENSNLTVSEIEIIRYIAGGFTTKQIAAHKHISHHTVMTHRKNIFRKVNVNNASELVMYAIRSGIIDTIEYHI